MNLATINYFLKYVLQHSHQIVGLRNEVHFKYLLLQKFESDICGFYFCDC